MSETSRGEKCGSMHPKYDLRCTRHPAHAAPHKNGSHWWSGHGPAAFATGQGANQGTTSWWVIEGAAFLAALRRAHAGEDPDLLYAEHYANSQADD